jgi:hypothetical protein
MKAQVNRNTEFLEATTLVVIINGTRFTLKETVDGKLSINKVSINDESDSILVSPRSGNEVDIF